MESPIITNKSLATVINIKTIAFDTLFTKYIVRDNKGKDKMTEIDSTDQESLVAELNGGYPIPGLMYTFIYKPGEPVVIADGPQSKVYSDKVPIILCTGIAPPGKFYGINMNALPEIERLRLLQEFYSHYKPFFKDVEDLTQNDKIALNKEFIRVAMAGKGQMMMKILGLIAGSNFNYGYRSYLMNKIDKFRMIEFSEWDYIPFYEPRDAFRLMNFNQIHNLYWRNK